MPVSCAPGFANPIRAATPLTQGGSSRAGCQSRTVGNCRGCRKQFIVTVGSMFDYANRVKLGVDNTERAVTTLRGIAGKRLAYRRSGAT